MKSIKTSASALITAACVVGLLSACGSKAGDMTCEEYGESGPGAHGQILSDLLDEHDLSMSSSNVLGAVQAVDSFCGIVGDTATKNKDRPLNDAQDWSAEYWGS